MVRKRVALVSSAASHFKELSTSPRKNLESRKIEKKSCSLIRFHLLKCFPSLSSSGLLPCRECGAKKVRKRVNHSTAFKVNLAPQVHNVQHNDNLTV